MTVKTMKPHKITPFKLPEDLLAVCHAYSLGKINYIDILQQEQFNQMMQHWPLFEELAQSQQTKE